LGGLVTSKETLTLGMGDAVNFSFDLIKKGRPTSGSGAVNGLILWAKSR
jgi:hypothetical protein